MVTAAILTFLGLPSAQEPPSWEQVLANMYRDVRTLKGVHEEWVLEGGSQETGTVQASFLRWFDGPRVRQEINVNGKSMLAFASDGARRWMAVSPSGFYVWQTGPEDPSKKKWQGLKKEKSTEPSFNIGMEEGYDISLRFIPQPTVTKLEEVDGERRIHAVMKAEGRQMNIIMRFEKEKWLLKELDGKSDPAGTSLSFKRLKSERDQVFESNLFALDSKIVNGLRELTGTEAEEFLKALKNSD